MTVNPETLQVILQFGATFSGVLLAFGLTLWHDRKKRHDEEDKNRIKTLTTIKSELELNLEHLKENPGEPMVKLVKFSTIAMDSATGSGNFALIDPKTQIKIVEVYRDMGYAEMYTTKVLSMLGSSGMAMTNSEQTFESFKTLMSRCEKALIKSLPEVIDILQREIESHS